MRIVADTNVLLRAIVADDPRQAKIAEHRLRNAEIVAVGVSSLCELAWVMRARYGLSRADVATAIRELTSSRNVVVDRPAVDAGLAVLDGGGDFADGVIDFEGRRLGGETFVSFDRDAVALLNADGFPAVLL